MIVKSTASKLVRYRFECFPPGEVVLRQFRGGDAAIESVFAERAACRRLNRSYYVAIRDKIVTISRRALGHFDV